MIEKQTTKEIKYLRTNNSVEFCGEDFNIFCREKSITRHKIVRHKPQQNGVAKRLNRTFVEKIKCYCLMIF